MLIQEVFFPRKTHFKMKTKTNTFDSIKRELQNIRTVDLTKESTHIYGRGVWTMIAMFGLIWFFFFMNFQIQLWNDKNIILSKALMELSDIDYPGVTFCSKSVNKLGVCERLGNYLNPDIKLDIESLSWIKKSVIKCAIEQRSPSYGAVPSKCLRTYNFKKFFFTLKNIELCDILLDDLTTMFYN